MRASPVAVNWKALDVREHRGLKGGVEGSPVSRDLGVRLGIAHRPRIAMRPAGWVPQTPSTQDSRFSTKVLDEDITFLWSAVSPFGARSGGLRGSEQSN